MSSLTTNYNLVRPALTDSPPDITATNPNWDTIDAQMKESEDALTVLNTPVTAALPTAGWAGTGPYTQTVAAVGIAAAMKPVVDLVMSAVDATAANEEKEYAKISKVTCGVNQITVKCLSKKPSVNLNIILRR